MSVDDLMKNYSPEAIQTASDRIKKTKEIKEIVKKLRGSQWSEIPLIFEGTSFILPALEDYRPLAVTLHSYGLWVEPIYISPPSDTAEKAFALHVNESEEGIVVYIDESFRMVIQGNHETGFILEIETKENTKIQHSER
jgi:hypothetical protein